MGRLSTLRRTGITEDFRFGTRLWCWTSPNNNNNTDVIVHQFHKHTVRHFSSQWKVDSNTGVVSFGGTPLYQTVIGLEIHAQLDVPTKLFSGCPVTTTNSASSSQSHQHNIKPNTSVWPFDVAVPGILPRLSQEAVQKTILAAAATKCSIQHVSRFERKHYFYADLPFGYQITQQRWPIARDGILLCRRKSGGTNGGSNSNNKKKKRSSVDTVDDDTIFTTRIERIQIEQDTGKTTLMTNPITKQRESLVDFNRAGRALIEIVFYPDIRSSIDAAIAVETLRTLLKHIGACNGKMEEGSLRCDLNVSIAPYDNDNINSIVSDDTNPTTTMNDNNNILDHTGNRVEVKNLNSIRQVQHATEYEALRQARVAMEGNPTEQETRTYDVTTGQTVTTRTKGGAKDYRFMPEPDLPPLVLDERVFGDGIMDLQSFLASSLPELPADARRRLQDQYGLSEYVAGVLTGDPPAIAMFDEAVKVATDQLLLVNDAGRNDKVKDQIPRTVANLLCNELFALVREFETQRLLGEGSLEQSGDCSVQYSKVTATHLGEVVRLLLEGTISNTMAKQLLRVLYEELLKESSSPSSSSSPTLSPRRLAQERGFQIIVDRDELAKLCRETIESSPDEMKRYRLDEKHARKITKFLLGKAMATSGGNAHPERLNEILIEVLQEVSPESDKE